jgi:hypothetical protein
MARVPAFIGLKLEVEDWSLDPDFPALETYFYFLVVDYSKSANYFVRLTKREASHHSTPAPDPHRRQLSR